MEKQLIISIGREFGSGGHVVAQMLADYYKIPMYDYNLLREVALERNVDPATLERYDEVPRNRLLTRTVRGYSNSPSENLANMQFDYLRKKAESGESFVVVGRCAETVLKDNPNMVSIFILGDTEAKIERTMQRNNLSRKEAMKMNEQHDRYRKHYHNYYCTSKWGDSRNYELSINSSKIGLEETARVIREYIASRK